MIHFLLTGALYILYPGEYLLGALLYVFTLCVLRRDIRRVRDTYTPIDGDNKTT